MTSDTHPDQTTLDSAGLGPCGEMRPRERIEAVYNFQPVDRLPRKEFYFWYETTDRWMEEGLPPDWGGRANLFGIDPDAKRNLFGLDPIVTRGAEVHLGGLDAPFVPAFEKRVVERTENYEIIQDTSGRLKRIFAGQESLAMPQYLHHAVASPRDWYEKCKFRMDPATPERWEAFEAGKQELIDDQASDNPIFWLHQDSIGGYMYLRHILGPEGVMYALYDMPEVVHDMMQTWLEFMDYSLARIQEAFPLDVFSIGEDICYKTGMLISPELFREFLMPHYQQLITNARSRNKKQLFFHVDTDGNPDEAIPLYLECSMDSMDPFEVAAGQDVVQKGEQYPDLVIHGGIDKRLLTDGADLSVLDRELERIVPAMLQRGGYLPTIDHGVPPDVPLSNYIHYRKRMLELDH